jgi:lysozyme family protein
MKENFDRAFLLVIGAEGKPTDDPDDPGGFTIWGLAKRYHPEIDANTTIEYARQVYRKKYWDVIGGDALPSPLDIAAFDCAVNPGTGVAIGLLKKTSDWQDFMILRLKYYSELVRKNPEKIKYFRGWANRVLNLWDQIKKGV